MNKKKIFLALSLVGMMLASCQRGGTSVEVSTSVPETSVSESVETSESVSVSTPEKHETFEGDLGETTIFSLVNFVGDSLKQATGRTGRILVAEGDGGGELGFEEYYGYKQQETSSTCSLYSDMMECKEKETTEKRYDPYEPESETYIEVVDSISQTHTEIRDNKTYYVYVTDNGDVDEDGKRVYATPGNYREVFELNSRYKGLSVSKLSQAVGGLLAFNTKLYDEMTIEWYQKNYGKSAIWNGDDYASIDQYYFGYTDEATGEYKIGFREDSAYDVMNTGYLTYFFILDEALNVKEFSFEFTIFFGAACYFTQQLVFDFTYSANFNKLPAFDGVVLDYNLYKDVGYIEPDIKEYKTTESLQSLEDSEGLFPYEGCTSLDSQAEEMTATLLSAYENGVVEPTRRYEEYQNVNKDFNNAYEQKTLNWTRYEDDVIYGTYTNTGRNPYDNNYSNSYYYQRKQMTDGKAEEAFAHMSDGDLSYKRESRTVGDSLLDKKLLNDFVSLYQTVTTDNEDEKYMYDITAWKRPAETINNSTGEKSGEINVILIEVVKQQQAGDYSDLIEYEIGYTIEKDRENKDVVQVFYTEFYEEKAEDWENKYAQLQSAVYGYRKVGVSSADKNYKEIDASSFGHTWMNDFGFMTTYFDLFRKEVKGADLPQATKGTLEKFEFAGVERATGGYDVYYEAFVSGETLQEYYADMVFDGRCENIEIFDENGTVINDVSLAAQISGSFVSESEHSVTVVALNYDWNEDGVVDADELVIYSIVFYKN